MPRFREYHLHLPNFHFDTNHDMRFLFAVRIIRDLVAKISLFFLPVYLFKLGQENFSSLFGLSMNSFQIGITTVAVYFLLLRLTVLLLSMPIARLMQKTGVAKMFAFGHIFYVLLFALLMMSTKIPWLIVPAALIDGLQVVFFWTPYHILLARNSSKNHIGQDLGLQQFLLQLVSILAPAFAGAGILYFGYSFVFLVAAAGVLLSMVFALQIKNEFYTVSVSLRDMREWLQQKSFRKLSLSYAGRYINDASLAVWPLYIFLVLGSIEKVGYLYTFSLFIAMVFSLFIGSYIDHHKQKKWFFASGGLLSIVWLVRSFVTSIWLIAFVDVADRLTANFYSLFFDAQYLKGGKGKQDISYFTYREVIVSFAALIYWSLFILIFILTQSWFTLFAFAAVGVALSLFVSDQQLSE